MTETSLEVSKMTLISPIRFVYQTPLTAAVILQVYPCIKGLTPDHFLLHQYNDIDLSTITQTNRTFHIITSSCISTTLDQSLSPSHRHLSRSLSNKPSAIAATTHHRHYPRPTAAPSLPLKPSPYLYFIIK